MDDDHRDNYWLFLGVFNIIPPSSLNREVMKVQFSSGGQTVFGKNDKHKVSELRKQPNELKVEHQALILVPIRAPNSQ